MVMINCSCSDRMIHTLRVALQLKLAVVDPDRGLNLCGRNHAYMPQPKRSSMQKDWLFISYYYACSSTLLSFSHKLIACAFCLCTLFVHD